jgi:hypothetical protein
VRRVHLNNRTLAPAVARRTLKHRARSVHSLPRRAPRPCAGIGVSKPSIRPRRICACDIRADRFDLCRDRFDIRSDRRDAFHDRRDIRHDRAFVVTAASSIETTTKRGPLQQASAWMLPRASCNDENMDAGQCSSRMWPVPPREDGVPLIAHHSIRGHYAPPRKQRESGSACSAVEDAHSRAGPIRRGEAEKVTPP